jgi:hypothetical protein
MPTPSIVGVMSGVVVRPTRAAIIAGMTTVGHARATTGGMRWGRIVVGGILLEGVLLLIALPILAFVPNPFSGTAPAGADFTAFYAWVAAACFAAGLLGGAWVGRTGGSPAALQGALAGIVATLIYLGICSVPPNTIAIAAAAYGPTVFIGINALRIIGATVGATFASRR